MLLNFFFHDCKLTVHQKLLVFLESINHLSELKFLTEESNIKGLQLFATSVFEFRSDGLYEGHQNRELVVVCITYLCERITAISP